jgi:hypothetical protein
MSKSNEPAALRRGRDPKKESSWRGRLSLQTSSGLSVREFCRREALQETAFYFWRREIVRRDSQAHAKRPAVPAFIELRAAPAIASTAEPSAAIELLLPSDRRLLIRGGFDASLLRRVLAVLEGVPC